MFWIVYKIVLFLHISLAITWVGGLLFIGWGIFTAVRHLTFVEQRRLLLAVMKWSHSLFTLAGIGVIMTGIVLGTTLGPINHWEDIWKTTYGNLWLTALIVSILSLAWGVLIGYKLMMKVLQKETIWELADRGIKLPLYQSLTLLLVAESVEPIGFVTLIYLMILL